MTAKLGNVRIPIQIDIGFGDVVTPKPTQIKFPSLLGLPTASLRTYPKETVVAEKYEAMVSLGIANSRMKDFYDVRVMAGFSIRRSDISESDSSDISPTWHGPAKLRHRWH